MLLFGVGCVLGDLGNVCVVYDAIVLCRYVRLSCVCMVILYVMSIARMYI